MTSRNTILPEVIKTWETTLGLKIKSPDDNFMDLGGDSLLATMIATQIQEKFDIELDLAKLFTNPTPRAMAASIEASITGRTV